MMEAGGDQYSDLKQKRAQIAKFDNMVENMSKVLLTELTSTHLLQRRCGKTLLSQNGGN